MSLKIGLNTFKRTALALFAFLFVFSFSSCTISTSPENTNQTKENTGTDKTGTDTEKTDTDTDDTDKDKTGTETETGGKENPETDTNYAVYELADKIEDGAILHAFCWSFNSIKNNLQNIKDAGFTAVQTSPVSKCRAGWENNRTSSNPGKISEWYYHYQPTEYVVGNYQLGTEDEFKAMCTEAHKLGIKIIVDAVMNHCTSEYNYISDNIKALAGSEDPKEVLFHDMTEGQWTDDRYNATQKHLSNLWEWKTQSKVVQNYLLDFLKACVKDGADGFRYDAARHIELPDDDSYSNLVAEKGSFQSDFWPTILQNGSTFQYGEILQDNYNDNVTSGYNDNKKSGTRIGAYQNITFGDSNEHFRTTASHYGNRVRNAVVNKNLSASFLKDLLMPDGASDSLTVTWVESHDNYYNDQTFKTLTSEQHAILGYALIAARKNGTPLFFDRPNGATSTNQFGSQYIGNAGSDMYKNSQVKALNFFRNAMAGTDELLTNPVSGNNTVLMIQRSGITSGTRAGFVLVNVSDSNVNISSAGCLLVKDGSYKDEVSGNTFTVKNGKVTGSVNANSVAVIFATASGEEVPEVKTLVSIKASAKPDWTNFYCYAYYGDGASAVQNAGWPGVKMTDEGNGIYSYELSSNLTETGASIIFNNGSGEQFDAGYINKDESKIWDGSWKNRE